MSRIVEHIREALAKRDGVSEEAMRPLAEAYTAEVAKVNERLSEAAALLQKGLRSEAIQRASLHPNAIDAAAALDFPESDEWYDVLQFLGVPLPPDINRDATQQLNEAIVESQPLAELLANHRRLAIAKAPLNWRLRILRLIAAADPLNPVWGEDVEAWERVRLNQIAAELAPAIKARDRQRVQLLQDELTKQTWRVPPATELVNQARNAGQTFLLNNQLEQLQTLAPQLHDAFGQFDESNARRLRQQWQDVTQGMRTPPPSEMQDQVAPALAWLGELDAEKQRQENRTIAVAALDRSLDEKADIARLERDYQRAVQFDEPLPIELEQRYRNAIATQELTSRRKWQALIAGIAGLVIVVLAGLGVRQYRHYQSQRIVSAAGELRELIDGGKLTDAEQFLQKLSTMDPAAHQSAEVQSLLSQLQTQQKTEAERRKHFEDYIRLAGPTETNSFDRLALNNAEKLAVTEEEKADAFRIRRQYDQWEQARSSEQTAGVLKQMVEAGKTLDEIEEQPASVENFTRIGAVLKHLASLPVTFPHRSSAANNQLDVLVSRAKEIRDAMSRRMAEARSRDSALARIARSPTLEAFAGTLRDYAASVPASPMAAEFEASAKELPQWAHAAAINHWSRQLHSAITSGLTPAQSSMLHDRFRELSGEVVLPDTLLPAETVDQQLTLVAEREELLDRIFADLEEATIAELVSFRILHPKAGTDQIPPTALSTRYIYESYSKDQSKKFGGEGSIGIDVVSSGGGAVERASVQRPIETIPEPQATIRWLVDRKQAQRAAFLGDWDTTFLKLIANLRERPDLDGPLKEMLITHLLGSAAEGSPFLSRTLRDEIVLLRSRGDGRSRWFDGENMFNPKLAADLETRLWPALSRAYANRQHGWDALKPAASLKLRWVGYLLRNERGEIVANVKEDASELTGRVYVFHNPNDGKTVSQLLETGRLQAGKVGLPTSSKTLVAGRPLFLAMFSDEPN